MSQFIEMFGGLCQDTPWSDVVTITNGKAYPEEYQEEGAYPICGSGGIMCYGEKKLCNGNTTILGRKGNINNPIFMESGYWIVDTAFSIDVDKAKLHPKFFYYWCCQYDFTKLNKQGVLPSLTRKDLEKVKMAIPQMRDQLKFVSIAEQADKSKFGDFKSQFIEMFGDQNTNDKQWAESLVKDEFKLSMGKTPARSNPECWENGTHKWISISDMAIYTRYTGDTSEYITDYAITDSGIKVVPKGTIIMSFKLSIGRTAITSEDIYTNEAIMAFTDFDKKKFNIDFLHFLIANKNWLLGAKQAVKGQTLNKESIGNAKIVIPPIALQEEFAQIYNQADKSKSVIQKALVYLNDIQSDELGKIA